MVVTSGGEKRSIVIASLRNHRSFNDDKLPYRKHCFTKDNALDIEGVLIRLNTLVDIIASALSPLTMVSGESRVPWPVHSRDVATGNQSRLISINVVHHRAPHPTERLTLSTKTPTQQQHIMSQQHQAPRAYTEADVHFAISDITKKPNPKYPTR